MTKYSRYIFALIFVLVSAITISVLAKSIHDQVSNEQGYKITEYKILPKTAKIFGEISGLAKTSKEIWQKRQLVNQGFSLTQGKNTLSFNLSNNSSQTKPFYIVFKKQLPITDIKLYRQSLANNLSPIDLTFDSASFLASSVMLLPFSDNTFFLTATSDTDKNLAIEIFDESDFYQLSSVSYLEQGFSVGGMVALSLAFLTLFFASGLKSILFLCGYFLTRSILLSVIIGGNLFFVFPEMPELRAVELPLVTIGSALFLLLFSVELFSLKSHFHALYLVIKKLCWLLIVCAFGSLLLDVNSNVFLSMVVHGSVISLLTIMGSYLVIKARPLALIFTIALSLQVIFFVLGVFTVQVFGFADVVNKAVFFGLSFWLNAFLIVFMLCRQYFHQLADKQKIQFQALESERATVEANEALLALQQENQEELETRVQERTLELNIALQELENSNRELAEKNTQDDLSGLYNRRFYDKKIVAEYRRSKRNLTPLSLVMIDIDYFKKVNDTHGHLAGDYCIRQLGHHIKESLKRSTDLGCRYGGEEFCLILPDTDVQGAMVLAESLCQLISKQTFVYQNISIDLTISCGVSTYQQQNDIEVDELFAAADKALYLAKANGRNQAQQHKFVDSA